MSPTGGTLLEPQEPLPFERLGEYTVLAPISEGGMASVWLGRAADEPTRFAALKVIRPEHGRNKEFVAMFIDEATIASRLSHPNIIAIHGLGHDGRRHFLAMEVLRGRTLLEVWERAHARKRKLPYELLAWIGARVADALHHAHELCDESGQSLQVIHRDVSPSNVFLTDDGVPKLIDFGLAKARDRVASTAIGVLKGKLAYLAPEQVLGKAADRRADVFALGVTLWEVSLDRRLFRSDSDIDTIRKVREAQVPDPRSKAKDYPPALAEVVVRALAKDPGTRWQTAGELRDALDAFVRESGRPADEHTMQAVLAELFDGTARAPWEKLIDDSEAAPDHVSVWDEGRQKMTWMNASVEAAPPGERTDADADDTTIHVSASGPTTRAGLLDAALAQRLAVPALEPAMAARAWLERALVDEVIGDGARAVEHAEASLAAHATATAQAFLRRSKAGPGLDAERCAHLDAELRDAASDIARADLLAERARLLQGAGDPRGSRDAWERVLAVRPDHAAALRGLEAVLAVAPRTPGEVAALVEHLGRMSDAYAGEPTLAAWLHVERAERLDRHLAQADAAKAALLRALGLDRRLGPVRAACVRHAVVHRDGAWFVALLADEAALEGDAMRAASLELDAACVARRRLGDIEGAVALLERAAARMPIAPDVHRRVLDELASIYDPAERPVDALRVRRLRLALLDDARARAEEHRILASIEESLGNLPAAVAALERALELVPHDATRVHDLDRMLAAPGDVPGAAAKRVELWVRSAAAATEAGERARRLLRAADLAASSGHVAKAVELARAAIAADPSDAGAVDRLLTWLAAPVPEPGLAGAEARISAHAHGAANALDEGRRIAHLEAIALLQEELLGDPHAAAVTYESVLRLDPDRRTSLVGLSRVAERAGHAPRFARALLDEARVTADADAADALRVRAAESCAAADAARALDLVRDVLLRAPDHAGARRLERTLHESAGRWAQAEASMATAIEHAREPAEAIDLWMARAELHRGRLRAPKDAVAALRAVLSLDAHHPGAREGLGSMLEAMGDPGRMRDGFVELAESAATAEERARGFARAAEIDEWVLGDDARAEALYARARAETPDSAWLDARVLRLLARTAREGSSAPLRTALAARLEGATGPAQSLRAFELAKTLMDEGDDLPRAIALIEGVLAADPNAAHALRSLEWISRATDSAARTANTLSQESDAFRDPAAQLGALWAEVAVVNAKLPDGDPAPIVDRILERAPSDRAALAEAVRLAIPRARSGDAGGHARLVSALRAQLSQAESDSERHLTHLALALLLEPALGPAPPAASVSGADQGRARAALLHYRKALAIDPLSVVAADGTARLGAHLNDAHAIVAAALSRADLTENPNRRAAFLVQAAGQTLSSEEPLGTRSERLSRAGELCERALAAGPEALPAVALLVAVRNEEGPSREARGRLIETLRGAFERARGGAAVVTLGTELARLAALEPVDRLLAVEALRRVVIASPGHGPSLRALADQYLAMGAWGDAVEALERVADAAREPRARLVALFDLARVFEEELRRPADVERTLRAALDIDPTSVEALQKLLAHRRAVDAPASEVAGWLARLGDVEAKPDAKAALLTELAELRRGSGDVAGAETALVEATAQAPTVARMARLAGLFQGAPGEYARALTSVVARQKALDRPDAASFAALGRLEVDALGSWADGVGHLRLALGLAPATHEARAALARGLVQLRAGAEAARALLPMLIPEPGPLLSLADPAGALATLETALTGEGRHDDAVVARELHALAGGLDDGAHADLRARRHATDPSISVPEVLDGATLRASVVPDAVPALLLDLAAAVAGAAGKFARVEIEALGVSPRDRLTGHPRMVYRLAKWFGLEGPDVVVSATASRIRVVAHDTPWLLVPESLLALPEPVQMACLVGPLVRLSLGVPWLEDLRGLDAQAVFCAAARQVVPGYALDVGDAAAQERIEELTRRIGRSIGRKQKKSLQELAPALAATRPPTLADVEAFQRGIAIAELRAAFLVTGDWLACLDAARASDGDLARATANVGKPALSAALSSALVRDLLSFALAPGTTSLRRKLGTTWAVRADPGRA